MKLIHAYTCYSCEEVFSGAPGGKCPVCSSDAVYPVGWFERPAEERTRWLGLINGKETSGVRRRLDEIKAAGWQKTILQKHVAKLQGRGKAGEQVAGLFTEGIIPTPGVVREDKLA